MASVPSNPFFQPNHTAFETGVFFRVDVPGANTFEVQRTNNEVRSRAVFDFKAEAPCYPELWENLDQYQRIYGGQIELPLNPKFSCSAFLQNGSLFMLFTDAHQLHFSRAQQTLSENQSATEISGTAVSQDQETSSESKVEKGSVAHVPQISLGTMNGSSIHRPGCSCCDGEKMILEADRVLDLVKVEGIGEVCEKKLRYLTFPTLNGQAHDWLVYLRFDMPGINDFEVEERKDFFVVRGGKRFQCFVRLECQCCKFLKTEGKVVVRKEVRDGVLRMILRIKSIV